MPITGMFTQIESVKIQVIKIFVLLQINCLPDLYKGIFNGTVQALALQKKAVYLNLISQWFVNLSLQYIFAFKLRRGLVGIWIAKVAMEFILAFLNYALIQTADWNERAENAKNRMKKDRETVS